MRCLSMVSLLLALSAACGGQPDAKNAGTDQDTAGAAGGGGAMPLIAIVRAADWMGREWSEDAIKLGEVQAQSGPAAEVATRGNYAAVRYLEGKDAGKFEQRTVVPIKREPAVGLLPIELWDGHKPHFGNPIVSVERAAARADEVATPAARIAEAAPAPPSPHRVDQEVEEWAAFLRTKGIDESNYYELSPLRKHALDAEFELRAGATPEPAAAARQAEPAPRAAPPGRSRPPSPAQRPGRPAPPRWARPRPPPRPAGAARPRRAGTPASL